MNVVAAARHRTTPMHVAAVVAALLLGAPVLWAMRPLGPADAEPHRLLPAPPAEPAPHDRGSALAWNTSGSYPVPVQRPSSPSTPDTGVPSSYTWLVGSGTATPQAARAGARWSPCAPLAVRVNPAGFTAAGLAELRSGLAELEHRTGLDVRLGEQTDETVTGPLATRRWSEGTWTTAWRRSWAPVLVFASDAERTPELAGRVAGWTHVRTGDQGRHLVSGVVALDVDDLGPTRGSSARRRLRMLLLHELGHLVGLGHVADPGLVMHPEAVPAVGEEPGYGYGDRLGLALAGRGPC